MMNGVAIVFIILPIFKRAGNDLNIVNPKPANTAFRIPPRKPPIPFLFLSDFKSAS